MKILVTGGAGFIGSNFIQYMLDKYSNYDFINLDSLNYCGNFENLKNFEENDNHQFIKGDINDTLLVDEIISNDVDVVVNFAAESHVDRSIKNPKIFLESNILGTQTLIEAGKKHEIAKFVQISTDEVYGSLGNEGYFSENTPLSPNSPYSASKAGADLIVRAYNETYGFPINITRCSNNYGPFQFPEKLIPLIINNALNNKKLPVYGDGKNIRDWLHVYDHCSAIDRVIHKGISGEVYNIGGNNEKENIEIVKIILDYLDKSEELIEFIEDRLGHDRRYAIDSSKIQKELGWKPKYTFESGITETIDWYLNNQEWLTNIVSGEYYKYYENTYKI
ncbi:MAG: dTDP-glucose 4,6-dehydratase [Methanobrevibacter sp.]|jgi:dTDP-glucose 4,6-dehydratase|nr:dTDP-glucose 4,6-dehydratase [Methanobrevibacter sp.]